MTFRSLSHDPDSGLAGSAVEHKHWGVREPLLGYIELANEALVTAPHRNFGYLKYALSLFTENEIVKFSERR